MRRILLAVNSQAQNEISVSFRLEQRAKQIHFRPWNVPSALHFEFLFRRDLRRIMASSSDEHDDWSDTSGEDEDAGFAPLHSRTYQVEMFEQSMQGNIIAVVRVAQSCLDEIELTRF